MVCFIAPPRSAVRRVNHFAIGEHRVILEVIAAGQLIAEAKLKDAQSMKDRRQFPHVDLDRNARQGSGCEETLDRSSRL